MYMKQCVQQENQELEKEFNKSLSEEYEETSSPRHLTKNLLKQIRRLKDEKLEDENPKNKLNKLENEKELYHLKNHNQSLFAQIKKLKDEKKTQQKMLDQLVNKESKIDNKRITEAIEIEKPSDVEVQIPVKETNTNLVNIKN